MADLELATALLSIKFLNCHVGMVIAMLYDNISFKGENRNGLLMLLLLSIYSDYPEREVSEIVTIMVATGIAIIITTTYSVIAVCPSLY